MDSLSSGVYDSHRITIVPGGPQTVPQDYKFLVLDKGGYKTRCPSKLPMAGGCGSSRGTISGLGHDIFISVKFYY
jgi:hypothetical protein